MRAYEEIDYLSSDYWYTNYTGHDIPLKFLKICDISRKEDMEELTLKKIRQNLLGRAAVGTNPVRGGGEMKRVLSYAALDGLEETEMGRLAVIGSVITLPAARRKGFATETVTELLAAASTPAAVELLGHTGFKAECNPAAEALLAGLGFTASGHGQDRQTMVKEI
jgi:GNAT superfamily N-acetyltransferase